jgi:hypothetical protein
MEMTAVIKIVRWGTGACVAALALALSCGVASAQQKAPETKKAEPVKKAAAKPKCNTLKEEAACGAGDGCQWVAASKSKAGKEIKAYCRTAPKTKAKPAAKAEPAKKAETAPKAPAPKN